MKPKQNRQYRGVGNRHNRFKRDTKRLAFHESKGAPKGFLGFRWQREG